MDKFLSILRSTLPHKPFGPLWILQDHVSVVEPKPTSVDTSRTSPEWKALPAISALQTQSNYFAGNLYLYAILIGANSLCRRKIMTQLKAVKQLPTPVATAEAKKNGQGYEHGLRT